MKEAAMRGGSVKGHEVKSPGHDRERSKMYLTFPAGLLPLTSLPQVTWARTFALKSAKRQRVTRRIFCSNGKGK